MNEVPKIVPYRLRATAPAPDMLDQAHPDADLLTAFAEQALAAPEREGVLQHLAQCVDCRDVVALALPQIDTATLPVEDETEVVVVRAPARRKDNRFSWASLGWADLRWAALAAGIVVAVLVARPGLKQIGKPQSAANLAVQSEPASPVAAVTQPTNSVAASVANQNAANRSLERPAEGTPRNVESKTGAVDTKSLLARRQTIEPPPAGMQFARNMAPTDGSLKQRGGETKDSFSASTARPESDYISPTAANKLEAGKSALSKSPVSNSTATVEVAAGALAASTEAAAEQPASPEPTLMARADGLAAQNAPRIEKAKPAFDEASARDSAVNGKINESENTSAQKGLAPPSAAPAAVEQAEAMSKTTRTFALTATSPPATSSPQSASWMVSDGVLQRSLDNGANWQIAARANHPLLCYANYGQEIWAGGQAGTLLRSIDNGATWNSVTVSFNGQQLSSDVTRVDVLLLLRPLLRIVLSTNTHETWTSSDSGKTWEKSK